MAFNNEKEHAVEHSYEKQQDRAPIDMTNRKDSIAFQEGAELYGSAETAESTSQPLYSYIALPNVN